MISKIQYECTCRIGQNSGICLHVLVAFIFGLSKELYSFDEFPLRISVNEMNNICKLFLLAQRILKTKLGDLNEY